MLKITANAKIGGISSGDNNNMTGTKLVVNASSLLLATARTRCVFVHVAVSVRLPSPRALRRNAYINQCDGRSARVSVARGVFGLASVLAACISFNSDSANLIIDSALIVADHHGLRGSASPVLTATGFVNGRWQVSTPHRIHTP